MVLQVWVVQLTTGITSDDTQVQLVHVLGHPDNQGMRMVKNGWRQGESNQPSVFENRILNKKSLACFWVSVPGPKNLFVILESKPWN